MATRRKAAPKRASSSKVKAAAPASAAGQAITLLVNGQVVGSMTPADQAGTIGEAGSKLAKDHGLKSFSILANSVKVSVDEGGNPVKGLRTLEVFAKDTRG